MRFSVVALLVIVLACNKANVSNVEIIGHAGNGLDIPASIYPGNSAKSVDLALSTSGVSAVEVDVQMSKEGTLWLLHDDQLSVETTGQGFVNDKYDDELKEFSFKGVHQLKLTKLLDLNFDNYSGKTFYLDVRHYHPENEVILIQAPFIQTIHFLEQAYPTVKFIAVTNYQPWVQGFLGAQIPVMIDVPTFSKAKVMVEHYPEILGVIIRQKEVTKKDVLWIKNQSKEVILFDMRSIKSTRMAMQKQPSAVMVDDIKTALIEKY